MPSSHPSENLLTFNGVEYPFEHVIHQFLKQVKKYPHKNALRYFDHVLTFKELDLLADKRALEFLNKGVTKGDRILLFRDRSLNLIVDLLAITKSGAAYVPVTKAFPLNRIQTIIQDADIHFACTDTQHVEWLEQIGIEAFAFSDLKALQDIKAPFEINYHQDDLAYILYTSGTTGKPKGVKISHRAVASFSLSQFLVYHLSSEELNMALSAPIVFDFSVQQWSHLLYGHQLTIIPEEARYDSRMLIDYCKKYKVNAFGFTPSEAEVHLKSGFLKELKEIKYLTLGGESVSKALWEELGSQKGLKAYNIYGPTESTVFVSYSRINADDPVTIGQAMPNAELVVVNESFSEVEKGQFGELLIGGACLSSGYVYLEDLNRKKFVFLPDKGNRRFYRSGDRVRWNKDGNLEFAGRIDRQVKVRGNRIELEEIEVKIGELTGVKRAFCTVVLDQNEMPFLVAYLKTDNPVTKLSWEEKIKVHLPDYMIPHFWIEVDEFALTTNGKIDAQQLPKPNFSSSSMYEAPATEIETAVAETWQDALQVKKVGRNDSFYQLGGHSLKAAQIAYALEKKLKLDVNIQEVLQSPILKEFAHNLSQKPKDLRDHFELTKASERMQPLSIQQSRLWILYRFNPESSLYNIPFVFEGTILPDLDRVKRALRLLVHRYEILRTIFFENERNEPVAKVLESMPLDIRMFEGDQSEAAIEDFLKEPFNLEKGPLFRVMLIFNTRGKPKLAFSFHHIITDGWSVGQLFKLFSEAYNHKELSDTVRFQYADYAQSQTKYFQNDGQREKTYWHQQLGDYHGVLNLPNDFQRQLNQEFTGNTLAKTFDKSLTDKINQFCKKEGISRAVYLSAVFQLSIHLICNQEDVLIGQIVANRSGKEAIQGLLSNTVLLRTEITFDTPFLDFLANFKSRYFEVLTHQEIDEKAILESLELPRVNGMYPLYQVVFNYQSMELNPPSLDGEQLTFIDFHLKLSKLDLTLNIHERNEHLQAEFEYASALFKKETVEQWLTIYFGLIEGFLSNPKASLSDVPLEKKAELKPEPTWISNYFLKQFQQQVNDKPEQTAVNDTDTQNTVSYQQLNQLSNQIAHYLLDASKDVAVAFIAERSIESLALMVAALKIGRPYLPIDEKFPAHRQLAMMEDSGCKTLWCRKKPGWEKDGIVPLKFNDFYFENYSGDDIVLESKPNRSAYIIYTSGTTGKPKGTEVSTTAFNSFIEASVQHYKLSPEDRVLQFATLSFDAAVEEIFPTLSVGATLFLRDENCLSSSLKFSQFCKNWKITILDLPTAFWHEWTNSFEENHPLPEKLRLLILGGEAMKKPSAFRWFSFFPSSKVELINTYGPTEATVVATKHQVSELDVEARSIPIGKPIANASCLVVNQWMNPVPEGIEGELLIGGSCLANGYLGNEELTKEKFIWLEVEGTRHRFYRSGDRVRRLPTGELIFLGRVDRQLKIRGFRVETSEIENYLQQFPGLKQVVVVGKQFKNQSSLDLVAYYTADREYSHEALSNYLNAKLPEYMVPSYFMGLEKIPLNKNKKVDEAQLPLPKLRKLTPETPYNSPKSVLQAEVLNIWKSSLGLEEAGMKDHFFNTGGQSLSAMKLLGRLEQRFGSCPKVKDFFEHPTPQFLSSFLEKNEASLKKAGHFELPLVDRDRDHELSASQQRMWMLHQLEDLQGSYNIPLDLELHGELDSAMLKQALEILIRDFESLRTLFPTVNGAPVQRVANEVELPLEWIDLRSENNDHQQKQIELYAQQTANFKFDLSKPPLWNLLVLHLEPRKFRLIFNFHHIISDGWSVGLFLKSLTSVYEAIQKGTNTISVKPFRDYVDWVSYEKLSKNATQESLSFWKSELANIPSELELPKDYPRPKQQTFNGDEFHQSLSPKLTDEIKAFSNRLNVSMNAVLLSAYVLLLHRLSGQNTIVVGTPFANREEGLNSDIHGVFINTLPIAFSINGSISISKLIHSVSSKIQEVLDHRNVPFEQILQELRLQRDLSVSPVFQTMFNFMDAHTETLRLGDVKADFLAVNRKNAKFDLSLIASPLTNGVHLNWEYNTDLFANKRVAQMAKMYTYLLQHFLKEPISVLSEIPLVKPSLLNDLYPQPRQHDANECLSILSEIERQSKVNPQKEILISGDHKLTFKSALDKVRQIGSALHEMGVESGDAVAFLLDRNENLPLTMLGIWWSGAHYIPLDPIYPEKRILHILEDVQPKCVITEKDFDDLIPKSKGIETVQLVDILENKVEVIPRIQKKQNDLAYVIYTSGSTGFPKGVEVSHGALDNFIGSMAEFLGFSAEDCFLAVTTISFDIAGLELLMPLFTGAQLVIAQQQEVADPRRLMKLMESHSITKMQATPVTWKLLYESGWKGNDSLTVFCGGEAFPLELAHRLITNCKKVYNMYGPTETTIWSMVQPLRREDLENGFVPIGKPIQNTGFCILDQYDQPLPIGYPGQLAISGKGLAQGYAHQPKKTQEAFLQLPFFGHQRFYKTGDRVVMHHNGSIEFLERIDQQVKLRGYRIELGEVENALTRVLDREAVVVLRLLNGSESLVAFFKSEDQIPMHYHQVIEELSQSLPNYMLPSHLEQVEAFPLTNNGKINRKELRQIALDKPTVPTLNEEVKDPKEAIVLSIWRNLFEKKNIGLHEDFFSIGGHSLLAVKMMTAIEDQTGVRLPLSLLFKHATISSLAQEIRKNEKDIQWRSLVCIQKGKDKKPLFLVHGAGLNILLFNALVAHLDDEQPVYGLQAKGLDGKSEPLRSIEEIAEHYIKEIQSIQPEGGYQLAGFSLGGLIAFEMASQLRSCGEKVDFLGMFDTVAYGLEKSMARSERFVYKLKHSLHQAVFIGKYIFTAKGVNRNQFIRWKLGSLQRMASRLAYKLLGKKVKFRPDQELLKGLPEYLFKLNQANHIAVSNYQLKPVDVTVHLFQAKHQTFYIPEPKYYGWKAFAERGVTLHDVPGEHSTIFAPPNDEVFGAILQEVLNHEQ